MWCSEVVRERIEAARHADPRAIPPEFASDVASKSDLKALCRWLIRLSALNRD